MGPSVERRTEAALVESRAAPAAKPNKHLGAELFGRVDACRNGVHGGFKFRPGEALPGDAAFGDSLFQRLLNAKLGKVGISHDEALGTL